MVAEPVAGRKIAPDMPEFLQIMFVGILGNFGAERGIAALPGHCGCVISGLGFGWQREELLGQIPGARNQSRINPVISDNGKAEAFKGMAQIPGKAIWIGGERKGRWSS
jgi:hypothetical protein